jgi:hypothetical protein
MNSRRRDQGLALAVLTVVLSLPHLAQAQQSGLFPLHPIKRQRVPCDQEDPLYKTYKQQYFGYYPTCWRTFPDGWGCPSREAPNKEEEFKKLPLLSGAGEPPTEEKPMEPAGPVRRPAVPNAPEGERSPFELDKPTDPFTTPPRPGTEPRQPRGNSPPPTDSPPLSDNEVPDLSAPADQPRRSQDTRLAHRETDDPPASGEVGDGPLLAVPDISVPSVRDSGAATAANSPPSSNTTGGPPAPRRGRISSFFSNLGWNWTRR